MHVPGMVFLGIVRSPYAHARITKVNVSPALAHAGVVAAWSGDDLADEWQGSLPCAWIPTEDTNAPGTSRSRPTRRATSATRSR